MISTRNRSPFTATQWQELEHQALIYKYMVSGVPIPPELIFSVKKSLDSSLASRFFPHQPALGVGWGCFQVGFGRKTDPEPGRCRRTDGKKWRCSKEAYPDSKYCERHMHRGRNRSRKPVETAASTTPSPPQPPPSSATASILSPPFRNFSFSPYEIYTQQNNHNSFPRPSASSGFGSGSCSVLSLHNHDTPPSNLLLDSGSGITFSQSDKHYRFNESMDERSFFPEASSGRVRVVADSHQPLTECSYKNYPDSVYQTYAVDSGSATGSKHCFVLGTDIKSGRPIKSEKDDEAHKPVHQFLGDHWAPARNTDSWLDLASNSGVHSDS